MLQLLPVDEINSRYEKELYSDFSNFNDHWVIIHRNFENVLKKAR